MIVLTSNFQQALAENDRQYDMSADITLQSGKILHLDNTDIWSGGVYFDDAVSTDESFTALGSTVINTAGLVINNISENFSGYDFTDALVVIYVSKTFGTITDMYKKGTYHVDDAVFQGGRITLSLVDMMAEFEKPYTTTLAYPATLGEIVRDACSKCGVSLQTTTFPHSTYSVAIKPDSTSLTYREVIGWCAGIAGCFARCDRNGKLELKWFNREVLDSLWGFIDGGSFSPWTPGAVADGGTFEPWSDGTTADGGSFNPWTASAGESEVYASAHFISGLYQENIAVDDTVVTQVRVIVKQETTNGTEEKEYTAGSAGYTIEIRDNDFITPSTAQTVVAWLGQELIGLTFRKASVMHTNTPAIEAGDIAVIRDRKGREYPVLVTRTAFVPYGQQTTVSASETPKRNSAARYSGRSKAWADANKLVRKEKTDREAKLDELAKSLSAGSGLYSTAEEQADGSTIYYLHDKPALSDSQIRWKMTTEAWGVSTDGGITWNAGMTVDGDTIVRILTATGVNASWIDSGALSITRNKGTDSAYEVMYANATTGVLRMQAKDEDGNTIFRFNSVSGDLNISAAKTKVGGYSLESYVKGLNPEMTKAQIFNKLTDNGAVQGIFMKNSKLYLNADYIASGTIASVSGNTQWDLDTGTLTMAKGSISLGTRFTVNSSGYLECTNANVSGTITGGTYQSGYWMRLSSAGVLTSGYGTTTYGTIDCSARTAVTGGATYNGLRISGDSLDLNVTRMFSKSYATARSCTMTYISKIRDLGNGGLEWTTSTVDFENGLMVTSL